MNNSSFYRRPLPETAVEFGSDLGKQIFRQALVEGYMEGYFSLAAHFHTQSEPAYCGLGTLVMVLNSLSIDPNRLWKGPWRWFGEEMLDCCKDLEEIKKNGLTLSEFACLARCNGATCNMIRSSDSTEEEFRNVIKDISKRSDQHVVVSYLRSALGQTGAGHFSPIGGYNEEQDLVLIMDVARFKYPPHWIPLPQLFQAMIPIDPDTNKSRGYLIMSRSIQPLSVMCRMLGSGVHIRKFKEQLEQQIFVNNVNNNVDAMIDLGIQNMDTSILNKFQDYLSLMDKLPKEHVAVIANMQDELKKTHIYSVVTEKWKNTKLLGNKITATDEHHVLQMTLALLVALAGRIDTATNMPLLHNEISRLSLNLQQVTNTCMSDNASTYQNSCNTTCNSINNG
jgi:hypothetical protein